MRSLGESKRITLECLKAENVIKRVGPSFEDIGKYFYQLLGNKNNTNYGNTIRSFQERDGFVYRSVG